MKYRILAPFVAISALLSGCSANVDEETAATSDELFFANNGHWPLEHDSSGLGSGRGADIHVCYTFPDLYRSSSSNADYDARMEFLPKVQHFIANTWSRIADINTLDWQECSGSTAGMLEVHITNSNVCPDLCPLQDVPLNLVIKDECEKQCRDAFWSRSNYYQGTGWGTVLTVDLADSRQPLTQVHEFGHALSFTHEFERPDWPKISCTDDSVCMDNKVGSVCVSGECECRSDADCVGSGYGGTCENAKCSTSTADASYATTKADFDSVLAATYFRNATDANTDGIADPMRSLSPFDVIGAQKIYGAKADGSIVGLDGKCVRAQRNSGLRYSDCQADGDDVFPSQWEPFGLGIPAATDAATQYRRLQTVEGSGQCWTTSGTRITSSACASPLTDTQKLSGQCAAKGDGQHVRPGDLCRSRCNPRAG